MHFENIKVQCLVCSLAFVLVLQVDAMRLCGTELPEMLERVCLYGYNTKMKRSYVPPKYNGIDNEDTDMGPGNYGAYSQLDFNSQPLLRSLLGESAHQLMQTRRRRFGASDECCRKSCTYTELSYYCKPGPSISQQDRL